MSMRLGKDQTDQTEGTEKTDGALPHRPPTLIVMFPDKRPRLRSLLRTPFPTP